MVSKRNPQQIRLGVFDLDGTLFSKSLPLLFAKWLLFKGHLPLLGWLKFCKIILFYRLFNSKRELFQEKTSVLLEAYFPDRRLEALSRQFLSKFLPTLLNKKVFVYLKKLQKAKVRTLLLSSSPDFLVRAVAKMLKIPTWKGISYKKGVESLGKREFLEAYIKKEGIPSKDVLAMADSLIDLPLLSLVGHPIVVDPAKPLRKISEERDWKVL